MRLPQILDVHAAAPLKAELVRMRGGAVELDASDVERLGGLCLQVLLAARAAWGADSCSFRIINPSTAFAEAARLMGAADLCGQGSGA
jgi:chemotaxis protein CheX